MSKAGKNKKLRFKEKGACILIDDQEIITFHQYSEALKKHELLRLKQGFVQALNHVHHDEKENLKLLLRQKIEIEQNSRSSSSTIFWPFIVALIVLLLGKNIEAIPYTIFFVFILPVVLFFYMDYRLKQLTKKISYLQLCCDSMDAG